MGILDSLNGGQDRQRLQLLADQYKAKYGDYEAHVNNCSRMSLKCPNVCDLKLEFKAESNLEQHLRNNCELMAFICQKCKGSDVKKKIGNHMCRVLPPPS